MIEQTAAQQQLEAGFRVGAFTAEPQLQRISGPDVAGTRTDVRVEPRVMDVLVCLAEQAGRTVSKPHFMETVWSDTVVTDDALLRCISELRKIFGDDPRAPRYIETIRKKGYRLIAPVVPVAEESAEVVPAVPAPSTPPEAAPAAPVSAAPPAPHRGWPGVLILGLLVLAAVVGVSLLLRPGTPPPLQAVPLTSYPGVESDPNLAPDGSRVAFVWNQGDGGSFDIYIKQPGDETPLRLTRAPDDDSSPTWSPDGRQLAFVRADADGYSVYVIPAVGGRERLVFGPDPREIYHVAWSPAGGTLALSIQRTPHAPFGIALLSLQTRALRTLTEPPADARGDLDLAFSPDGTRLAFVRSTVEKVDDIYVVPVAGGELKRLTFEHAEITGLDWTPDGRALIYTSDRAGSAALWRIPAAGGLPTWVPTAGEGSGVHQPSLSHRGRLMAFVQRLQETNIWSAALPEAGADTLGQAPHLLIASTRWDSNPARSPDGTRVAFASNRTGSYEIWTADADGTHPVQITRLGGPFTHTPRWSPDGSRLAFVAAQAGSVDIYVVDAGGGPPRRLTTAESNDTAPSWSHDGTRIYFASNRTGSWEVWQRPADGSGTPRQVTTGGGYAAQEDPAGRFLFFTRRDAAGLWRMPAGGGPATRLVDTLAPYDWGNWVVGEAALYFVQRPPAGAVLTRYDLATGRIEPLRVLSSFPKHPGLSLSPDGRRLLFTRIDRLEGDILLVEDFE